MQDAEFFRIYREALARNTWLTKRHLPEPEETLASRDTRHPALHRAAEGTPPLREA
jgi:hypothetical protein